MLAGQFVGKGSLFVSVMFLSRYLTGTDFGSFLLAIVLGQVYLFLSDMGISLILNSRSSVRPADTQELLSTSLTLKMTLSLSGLPLLMLAGFLMNFSSEKMLVLGIIGISVFFESFAEMFYSVFRARERMMYESNSRIAKGIIGLAAILLIIRLDRGLIAVAIAYAVRAVTALVTAAAGLRLIGLSLLPSIDRTKLKELFIHALPLGIMGLVVVIHQKADNILIRQLLGENAVAAWQECLRIVELMLLAVVPTLLPGALFPSLCRAFREGGYQRQTGNMARIFTGLAVLLFLAVLSTGEKFLKFIWGSEYLRGISSQDMQLSLYLCMTGLLAVYLMNILLASLLAVNRIRIVVPVTIAAMILVIGGNLLFMPVIGLPAAGIFFVASNLLILVSYWVFLRWRGYYLPIWREAFISVLVSLPVFAVIPLIRRLPFFPALILPPLLFVPVWWFSGGRKAIQETFTRKPK